MQTAPQAWQAIRAEHARSAQDWVARVEALPKSTMLSRLTGKHDVQRLDAALAFFDWCDKADFALQDYFDTYVKPEETPAQHKMVEFARGYKQDIRTREGFTHFYRAELLLNGMTNYLESCGFPMDSHGFAIKARALQENVLKVMALTPEARHKVADEVTGMLAAFGRTQGRGLA